MFAPKCGQSLSALPLGYSSRAVGTLRGAWKVLLSQYFDNSLVSFHFLIKNFLHV